MSISIGRLEDKTMLKIPLQNNSILKFGRQPFKKRFYSKIEKIALRRMILFKNVEDSFYQRFHSFNKFLKIAVRSKISL